LQSEPPILIILYGSALHQFIALNVPPISAMDTPLAVASTAIILVGILEMLGWVLMCGRLERRGLLLLKNKPLF
jgi:hypothetical protein